MPTEVHGQTLTATVGELISLTVKYKTGWGVLRGIEWEIPDQYVKDYTDGQTKAEVTELPEDEKKKRPIRFYFVDGGKKVVKAKCDYQKKKKHTKKTLQVTYDVKAPTLDKFNAVTDVVGFTPSAAAPTRFKLGVNKAGIKWDWKVTVPGTHDGYVKDVQTIVDITKRTTTGGTKQVWTIAGTKVPPPHVQLDTDNPYSLPGDFHVTKGFPTKVSAGGSYNDNYTSDSPSTPLGGTKRKFVHDKFKYYIMYKPDTTDAIWVPVAKAEWYWKGDAEIDSATAKWKLKSKGGAVTAAGSVTTEFPKYESNVKYNTWQNE